MIKKSPHRELIRSAAEALVKFTGAVNSMEPDELRAFMAECDKLTQTNCWWLEYRIAPLLKQEAKEALSVGEAGGGRDGAAERNGTQGHTGALNDEGRPA